MSHRTRDLSRDEAMDYINSLKFDDLLEFDHKDTEFVKKYDPDRIQELIDSQVMDVEDKIWYKELFEIPLADWEKTY